MDKKETQQKIVKLLDNLSQIVVGKRSQIEKTLACMIAEGHLLLEDMPGVGKTTLASALAMAIGGVFNRIQFTADLLPSDVIGTRIYRRQTETFDFVQGPIFANVVLADELNRAPPKTQSALLQAMNEFSVSVEKQHFQMTRPFMVIATQNPKGFHGTYPLPESQRDRFMMRLSLGYPDVEAEIEILRISCGKLQNHEISGIFSLDEIIAMQGYVREISVSEEVLNYVARLVSQIRTHSDVDLPVSPRGSIALVKASQAIAFMRSTDYVTIDIIKELATSVCAHRIGLKRILGSGAEGVSAEWFNQEILQRVRVD